MDCDDIGEWLHQQKQPTTWTRLLPEQQQRLTVIGVQPNQKPSPAPAASRGAKRPSKTQQAFQRGLTTLTQWVEWERAHQPIPRTHGEQITIDGEAEPVVVKLGVWVSKPPATNSPPTSPPSLAKLGIGWV
ncbi:hypothetical protein ACFY04_41400 [Streptomyces sp. NPDC001549]|uniref:hypothetical protein n=1 Tax=Streptomyces sp. NPDC001549 TaxID=3364586 RepID=UPI003694E425